MNPKLNSLIEFGIINIDKPTGPTSFTVSDYVHKLLGVRKTSHFGTLDPKVTGVLPIALNRACKLTRYFIGHDKVYAGIMRIHRAQKMEDIQKIINKKFLGKIKQLPPVKSRVKRAVREREVKKFKLIEQDGKDILFEAHVQGGTYIRKLISDLGEFIGGAHMLELRRTRAGIFKEKNSITLYELEKAIKEKRLEDIIIPAEIISKIHSVIKLKAKNLNKILTGKPIYESDLVKKEKIKKGEIACAFFKDRFIGMYEIVNNKDYYAKSKFVMQPLN